MSENTSTNLQRRLNQKMNYIRKFKKNSKALSPVVASIILIAVTVAVSVVVAAWMGGMTIGLMGSAEQVSINAQATSATTIAINIRNTGGATVTITNTATIDGNSVGVAGYLVGGVQTYTIAKGTSQNFSVTLSSSTNPQTLIDGAQYTLKLQTAKGNTLTSTLTYSAP
jgi:flagellin-like protein